MTAQTSRRSKVVLAGAAIVALFGCSSVSPVDTVAVDVVAETIPQRSDAEQLVETCRLIRVASDAMARYSAAQLYRQDGAFPERNAWEAAWRVLSYSTNGDPEMRAGVEESTPGGGATHSGPAFSGLDRMAARCEELHNAMDADLLMTVDPAVCVEARPDVVAIVQGMLRSDVQVAGPYRTAGDPGYTSVRVETSTTKGVATWYAFGDGVPVVVGADRRAVIVSDSMDRSVYRGGSGYDDSRACAAQA